MRDHTVLPPSQTFIHKWNEPLFPSHRSSLHFGQYISFAVIGRRLGWPRWLVTYLSGYHRHIAGEGHCVIAAPCPWSTARLQRSPIGCVESFHSWLSHLFRGRPGGRRHVRSRGRLSDTLMWSRRAMFAGVLSSRATFPSTEMCRRDRRWDSKVRLVRCSTLSF